MDILAELRTQFNTFGKARRKIAGFILEYPEKCSFLPLKDLAEQAGTTEVTVLNFCRDLGFKSYADFRREMQDDLVARVEIRQRMKLTHIGSRSEAELYEQVAQSSRKIIESTYAENDVGAVLRFCGRLADAGHIFVVGHNVTAKHAQALSARLLYQGLDARFLDTRDREAVFSALTLWPPKDCLLVAFGITPVGTPTLSVADLCGQLGIEVLAVTDKASSPLARAATTSLLCNVRMMNLYNSSATMFIMLDMILVFLAAELDKRPARAVWDADKLAELRRHYLGSHPE